jgi:hypothetical protein
MIENYRCIRSVICKILPAINKYGFTKSNIVIKITE